MTASLRLSPTRRHQGGCDSVPLRIAAALGISPRKAEHELWGPLNAAHRAADIIRTLKAIGADDTLVRFIQPIDLAIRDAQPEALRRELVLAEQEADGAEDVAESAFLTCQDLAHAKAYVRRCDETIAATTRLRNAVAARFGL